MVNMSWRDRGVILYLDHHGGRKHGNDSSHLQTSDLFMHERHGQQDRKHGSRQLVTTARVGSRYFNP